MAAKPIEWFVLRTQPGTWHVICDYPKDNRKALAIVEELRRAVERRPKHRLFDRIWAGSWLPSL